MQEKLVTLVDRNGKKLGSADLYEAHRHPAQLHKAVSVWLIKDVGEKRQILFQKRSTKKIVGASQWGNSICGNVRPDEEYLGCANRRLKEEIGIEVDKLWPIYRFEYQVYSNPTYGEHELDQVYIAQYDGEFLLNPDEVQEIVWVDMEELSHQVEQLKIVDATETLLVPTDQLKETTPAVIVEIQKFELEISPWTAIMLGDSRLWESLRTFA